MKSLITLLIDHVMRLFYDVRAIAFDFMGIIFMVIAILIGNVGGSWVAGMIGITGGLIGAFVVGAVVYVIFCVLTGAKMNIVSGAIFAILVYVSGIITSYVSSMTGWTGAILTLILQATVLSMLWGYFGKGKSPLTSSTRPRKKSNRRR